MTDRQRRLGLAAAGMALAGVASAIAPIPPAVDTSQITTRLFAGAAAVSLVGVAIGPAMLLRGSSQDGKAIWVGLAAIGLVFGVLAFVLAGARQRTCTARYDGKAVFIGTELTPLGQSYARDNPGLSTDELLFDAAGVADRLWTRASIDNCRTAVGATYFLWIPCLFICLVASVQVLPAGLLPIAVKRTATAPAATAVGAPRYDAFISYRHGGHDGEFARELAASLDRIGYRVAIDERDFPGNASFLQEMERCIRESRYTIAVISSRYLDSGHCEEEAVLCKVLDLGDRRRRLIPLVIEAVALPAWLFGIVGIDWTKPDPLVDPFEKLRATLGAPGRVRTPLPATDTT
jgi:hypothetical protein